MPAMPLERVNSPSRFRRLWLPVLVYVAVIFTLSAQPGLTVPGTFEMRDKLAHTLEYGGLGLLSWRAARDTWPAAPLLRRALLVALAVAAVGALDEKFQSYVPLRDSTILDWYADATGATLAVAYGAWRETSRRKGA